MDATTTEKVKTSRVAKAKPQGKAGSKREKFVLGAELRTSNAIRTIRMIGKLSNRAQHDYTETDVRKITGALAHEIESLKARLSATTTGGIEFKL